MLPLSVERNFTLYLSEDIIFRKCWLFGIFLSGVRLIGLKVIILVFVIIGMVTN